MISQTLTVTGANRPIFVTPQGLDLAFSKVLWVLMNSLGNALGDIGSFVKAQTYEWAVNAYNNRGFRTNGQFYGEVGQLLNGLGLSNSQYADANSSYGSMGLSQTQLDNIRKLKEYSVVIGNDGNRLYLSDKVDKKQVLKSGLMDMGAAGLNLMFMEKIDDRNTLWDSYEMRRGSIDGLKADRVGEYLNDTSEAGLVRDGSIVARNAQGIYSLVTVNQVQEHATVYINGIDNKSIKDAIGDGAALRKSTESLNTYFVYNRAKAAIPDFARALNAGGDGSMLFNEASANTLSQLLMAGKVDNIVAHSNGNNIALNTLFALEQTGMNFSKVNYFGVAPTHGPQNDSWFKPEIMPSTLSKNSAFFMHTDDHALNWSAPLISRYSPEHPMQRLAQSVVEHGYRLQTQKFVPSNNITNDHTFQGYAWSYPAIGAPTKRFEADYPQWCSR
jgi:hypothetical protein